MWGDMPNALQLHQYGGGVSSHEEAGTAVLLTDGLPAQLSAAMSACHMPAVHSKAGTVRYGTLKLHSGQGSILSALGASLDDRIKVGSNCHFRLVQGVVGRTIP